MAGEFTVEAVFAYRSAPNPAVGRNGEHSRDIDVTGESDRLEPPWSAACNRLVMMVLNGEGEWVGSRSREVADGGADDGL